MELCVNEVKMQVDRQDQKFHELQNGTIKNTIEKIRNLELAVQNNQTRTVFVNGSEYIFNLEIPRFKNYRRNPIEFLCRFHEFVARNNESNWITVRQWLDTALQGVSDCWWSANRSCF